MPRPSGHCPSPGDRCPRGVQPPLSPSVVNAAVPGFPRGTPARRPSASPIADRRSPLLTPRSAAGLCASLGRWMSVSSGADSRTLFLTSFRSHFPAGPPAGHRPSMLPQPPNPFSGDQPSTPSRLGRLQPRPALSSYRLPPNLSSPSATRPSKSIDASSASHPPLI